MRIIANLTSELTIDFGTRMYYLARMVSEPGKVHAIFLAGYRLGALALLNVKDLNCLIVTGSDQIVALVVKVQRSHKIRRFWFATPKGLNRRYQ